MDWYQLPTTGGSYYLLFELHFHHIITSLFLLFNFNSITHITLLPFIILITIYPYSICLDKHLRCRELFIYKPYTIQLALYYYNCYVIL